MNLTGKRVNGRRTAAVYHNGRLQFADTQFPSLSENPDLSGLDRLIGHIPKELLLTAILSLEVGLLREIAKRRCELGVKANLQSVGEHLAIFNHTQ